MNVELSIIVPVYNVECYLHECIESILNQSLFNFEVILVDDGSLDNSGNICDVYMKKDRRIVVVHKENGGLSSARNVGLNIAKGKYIGFVDSDDYINENMYTELLRGAYEHDADIVACNILIKNKDNTERLFYNGDSSSLFNREAALRELYLNERLTYSAVNKIYKKELFNNLRFKDGIVFEDMDLSYQLIHKAKIIFYIPNPFYNYRYNSNSILRSEFSLKMLDQYDVKKAMYDFYLLNYPDFSDELYADMYFVGLYLFGRLKSSGTKNIDNYKYLIKADKYILKRLVFNKHYSKKKKVFLLIGLISSEYLEKVYRYYNLIKFRLNKS